MAESESPPEYPHAAFAVGCGRSGTHFLAELFRQTPGFTSLHCDDVGKADGDSYLGYTKWHELTVRREPLLDWRERLIRPANLSGLSYFESNCYLSLAISDLYGRFHGRFVFTVRNPIDVVNSLFIKGWYEDPVTPQPTYDYSVAKASHSFGRLTPSDPSEYERWSHLTRIGRIAWFWNALNLRILGDLQNIPRERWRLIRLDAFNHARYLDVVEFLEGKHAIQEGAFLNLVNRRPGRGQRHRHREDWSSKEAEEFTRETAHACEQLQHHSE